MEHKPEKKIVIHPRCETGENIFVSNESYLLPCCFAHIFLLKTLHRQDRYDDDDLWFARNLDLFDLRERDILSILADPRWQDLRDSWAQDRAPFVCYSHCGVPVGSGFESATEVRKRDRVFVSLTSEEGKRKPQGAASEELGERNQDRS